jgi:hypothetical protein
MWAVVEFPTDKSVAAVPVSWLNLNDCFWPPLTGDKLRRAIRTEMEPEASWQLLPVRIFEKKYGMLAVINVKLLFK